MIPAWREDGELPSGIHRADIGEVDLVLVKPFPESNTRRPRYREWRKRRSSIAKWLALQAEWIGGSFASSKVDPSDMDLVTFVDGATYDQLAPMVRAEVARHVAGATFDPTYGCDGHLISVRPAGHPLYELFLETRETYAELWGHTRDGRDRGFIEVGGEP